MHNLAALKAEFESFLKSNTYQGEYPTLYDPVNYILEMDGKRIRPVLVLAALEALGENINHGFEAAMAVEIFHNFTLVHDDIMDDAQIRRGQSTVHEKWDLNTAILSGDVMMINTFEWFLTYEEYSAALIRLFTKTGKEVCEGQRLDMDFEVRDDVAIPEYIHMITYKTAVLLGCALQMGAIIAGKDEKVQKHIFEFGLNVGIAFQIQDDLIDTFGDQQKIGKKKGGDILQNKKTYLYLKSLELLSDAQSSELRSLFQQNDLPEAKKIDRVTELFEAAFVKVHAEELKNNYRDLALSHLTATGIPVENQKTLLELVDFLQTRDV